MTVTSLKLRPMRWHFGCALVAATMATSPVPSQAQSTTGAPALDRPLSVRSVGMGVSGTADIFTPGNVFYNPATVTAVNGVYSTGSYELVAPGLSRDIWFGHMTFGVGRTLPREKPFRLAFELTLARLSYGKSIATDPQGRPLGEYDNKEGYVALTAGISTAVTEHTEISFGAAFKRYSSDYGPSQFPWDPEPVSVSANVFDLGTLVSVDVDASGWRIRPAAGLAVVNVGSDIDYGDDNTDPLPTWINYGVTVQVDAPTVTFGSTDIPPVAVTLNVDGKHGLSDQRPTWGIGAELAAMQLIFIRWGQRMDDFYHYPQTTWGAAIGVAAGSFRARIEYANLQSRTYSWNVDKFGFTFVWLFGGGG